MRTPWIERTTRRAIEHRRGQARYTAELPLLLERGVVAAGPREDPGVQAALAEGMIARGPAVQREQMRTWMAELLGIDLPEPDDCSGVTLKLRLKKVAVSIAYLSHARFRPFSCHLVVDCRSWLVAS